VNLIGGTLREVLTLLDGPTYGHGSTPGTRETLESWRTWRTDGPAGGPPGSADLPAAPLRPPFGRRNAPPGAGAAAGR
jgi:hypothetical protein